MALAKCKECGEEISKKADKCPKCGAPQKKKTSLFTWLVTIIVVFLAVSYFSGNSGTGTSSTASSVQSAFQQVGYLKDNAKNRIFTIAYKPGTTEQEIRSHAQGLMYTQGQMMAAYFYPEGSVIPADAVTLAGSVFKANDVLFETLGLSKWRYVYMRQFNGTSEFVDCAKTPGSDLCRKK